MRKVAEHKHGSARSAANPPLARMLVASRSSSAAVSRASGSSAAAVVAPRPACRLAPTAQPQQHCEQVMLVTSRASGSSRQVQARFFRFGKNGFGAEDAGIVGSQGREDYNYDDVEQYFNYMGFLATEGTYDRMEAMLKANHPIDVILLLACSENDTPKVGEILKAGADVRVKGLDGKTPMQLASKPELIALLKEYEAKAAASV